MVKPFSGFFEHKRPVMLDELRRLASDGRWPIRLNLYLVDGRWVIVYSQRGRGKWSEGQGDGYLMAETSGKPRFFAKADTALRVVEGLGRYSGIYVTFSDFGKVTYGPVLGQSIGGNDDQEN